MPFFSVIIPVYNVEKYLNKCVDSVLNQEFKDLEVILVDDGSPDDSPKICDEYAERDRRVKVIHKENGGLSDARNVGIDNACGEYIIFLDSDDYWNKCKALQNIYNKAQKKPCDVFYFRGQDYSCITNKVFRQHREFDEALINSMTAKEQLKYFLDNCFPYSSCILVIKRMLIIDKKIYFLKNMKSEDLDWMLNLFFHSDSFGIENEILHTYFRYRGGSITTSPDQKHINDLIYIIDKWSNYASSEENLWCQKEAYNYLADIFANTLVLGSFLPSKKRKPCLNTLKGYVYL